MRRDRLGTLLFREPEPVSPSYSLSSRVDTTTKRPVAALLVTVLLLALTTLSLQAPAQADADAARRAASSPAGWSTRPPAIRSREPKVKVFRINSEHLLGRRESGAKGRFRIKGLPAADEELEVRVNGSAVGYESGWVGCAHNVVPSWAEACSDGQGRQTRFRIQHL